jgi:hypothetical protein
VYNHNTLTQEVGHPCASAIVASSWRQ